MNVDQFPLLQSLARSPKNFAAAVLEIAKGIRTGSIRNVTLNEAKRSLSTVVYDGWRKHVSEPYFYGGKWEDQPKDAAELNNSISVYGLHDVIATNRKLAKSKAQGAAVNAMRAFIAEALPLAEAVASLKDKVVMGRAPSAGPSLPANPNKVVKTCPCCFRTIAVQRGTMAHHGYTRPRHGWQTSSCPGIRFKPLEVSSEGLEWLITALRTRLEFVRTELQNKDSIGHLIVTSREGKQVRIEKGSEKWGRAFARHVGQLQTEAQGLEQELPELGKKLAEWKPEERK